MHVVVDASPDHMVVGSDVCGVLIGVGEVQHAVAQHLDPVVAELLPGVVPSECLWVVAYYRLRAEHS